VIEGSGGGGGGDSSSSSSTGGDGGDGGGSSLGVDERWETAVDAVSRRPYFFNRATGVSRWDLPSGASLLPSPG